MTQSHSCCSACGGCRPDLELTDAELRLLEQLAQIPFLPIARRADSEIPCCLVNGEDLGLAAAVLSQKQLVELDYDQPLKNFDYSSFDRCPLHGSAALTARGQRIVEQMDILGLE